ncbi:MAG: hypothetical protein HYR71_13445 [Chloroflexi bacterium]|nr:hypothetical protein [Chloroflexota bacterium]
MRFFMKGNNYPPGDTRIAVMTHADYERDLRLAKDAHMNFLRVHAHVEKPAFYAAADEMGILLWQDFPLQWGYAREVLAQAERQAPLMVRALANHPSIALWCMHNEPIYIIDTEERGLRPLLTAGLAAYVWSWDRNVMDTRLKAVAESCDPTRPVIRASGKWALPWLEDTDSHFYFGWYKAFDGPKRRFELIKRLFPRSLHFVTEFGAQSFPNLESAVKFMDADIQRVDWAHLAERHHFQPKVMADWYNWRGARSLAALIDLTQDYQIEINQYYIDWLRFHKYRPCGGFAPFMFHDSNPAVQWSILDYWRVPKRSYFHMQVALNPEYVFTLIPKNRYRVGESVDLPVYAVNDARMTYDGIQVRATLFDPAGQTEWQSEVMTAALEGDCMAKHVGRAVFAPKQAGRYQLALEIRYGDRQLRNEYRLTVGD